MGAVTPTSEGEGKAPTPTLTPEVFEMSALRPLAIYLAGVQINTLPRVVLSIVLNH